MAITPTLRFLLKQYGSGGDPHPNRAEFNAMIDALENNAAMFSQGITTARPAAGKRGRFYYDETVDRLYYDTGATWKDANPNGGGGAGAALAIGGAGNEGTSGRAARADHVHPLPPATAAVDGAMPKADKAKLDAATDAATASTLARRDSSGRVAVGTPTATGHATTKNYVDGQITAVETGLAEYIDTETIKAAQVITGRLLAGAAKPADQPWKSFEGILDTTTGAGGDNRVAPAATDALGYGGFWFGYQGLPAFQGIHSVQLTAFHDLVDYHYVATLTGVSLTRIKWRGRRLDGSGWSNGYLGVSVMVKVLGW